MKKRKIETQWDTDYSGRGFSEEDKKEILENVKENNSLLLYCAKADNMDSIEYCEKDNILSIDLQSECGYSGGYITTDSFTNETLENIINCLTNILYRRRKQEAKTNENNN